jgi:predicted nucleic acid-binding protein
MNAVDTNVLIYVHDARDPIKQAIARDLIDHLADAVLIWQVACEYIAATRKLAPQGYTSEIARHDVDDFRKFWKSSLPSWEMIDRTARLEQRYSLSWWDRLLVAACLEAGVKTLYTEDFGAYGDIDGLKIVNPFVATK